MNSGLPGQGTDSTLRVQADGRHRYLHCGLAPDTLSTAQVTPRSGVFVGAPATASGRTLAGAPAGTPLEVLTVLESVVEREVVDGKAQYCMTTTWEAPVPVDGWPVGAYAVDVETELGGESVSVSELSAAALPSSEREFRRCGAVPSEDYSVVASVVYEGLSYKHPLATLVASPSGAAPGTLIGVPTGLSVLPRKLVTPQGATEYCARVSWTAPPTVAGFERTGYELLVKRVSSVVAVEQVGPGEQSREVCGLGPSVRYSANVTSEHGAAGSAFPTLQFFTMDAGAPRGTTVPPPALVTLTTTKNNVAGKTDYCANVGWSAPAAVDGFPVGKYVVIVNDVAAEVPVVGAANLAAELRSTRLCGLEPGRAYTVSVAATYGVNKMQIFADDSAPSTTPQGAPRGTSWPTT